MAMKNSEASQSQITSLQKEVAELRQQLVSAYQASRSTSFKQDILCKYFSAQIFASLYVL